MSLPGLLRGYLERLVGPGPDAELLDAVAWAVDLVEPRLRHVGGYPQRYAAPLSHVMAYCRDLAAKVPGPVAVDRQAFVKDPRVHALFASPEDIAHALAHSEAVRRWRLEHGDVDQVFALLGFRRKEKQVLGMETRSGRLRRDVSQQVVYFSDHTFTGLAQDAAAARALLQRHFLESLVQRVRRNVDAIQERKWALERQRDEVRARLRARLHEPALQNELATILEDLGATVAALDLRAYAAHFDTVLLHPEQYLRLDARTFCLDAMGVRRANAAEGGQCLDLQEMTCRDQRRWGVLLAQVRLQDLPPYQHRLDEEARWLEI